MRARTPGCLPGAMTACFADTPSLPSSLQVFGEVLDGMDIVKLIESKGSQSGSTSAKVTIADSGELSL